MTDNYTSQVQECFKNSGFVLLKDFLDKDNCKELTDVLKEAVERGFTHKDEQCPVSEAIHGHPAFDSLLEQLLPNFEEASGKKLIPTYSYARLYKPGEELKIHVDRPACEISATLTLSFEGEQWPIYMGEKDGVNAAEVLMEAGDAVLYRGMEKYHWRNEFKGVWQAQVFLHYVDANGPHAKEKYDGRNQLGQQKNKATNYSCWLYEDILTPEACDSLVRLYSGDNLPSEEPTIGHGVVDRQVRNVKRIMLPSYKDIGGRLAAVALDANHQVWKFNISHAEQSEFLIYKPEGKYEAHVDTFINPHQPTCRKLTTLAFLNDDFEGGRFYLMIGHQKYYPKQAKGTVLVFPSFILHGVEPITSGVRYSAVTWMVGPWFK